MLKKLPQQSVKKLKKKIYFCFVIVAIVEDTTIRDVNAVMMNKFIKSILAMKLTRRQLWTLIIGFLTMLVTSLVIMKSIMDEWIKNL